MCFMLIILISNFQFKQDIMARLEKQETAEYYNWLLRIERAEFEKELLEIVSINLHNHKIMFRVINFLVNKSNTINEFQG